MSLRPFIAAAALFTSACGGGNTVTELAPVKPNEVPDSLVRVAPPRQSVYLRASFDDDPSAYVGRFIPNDLDNSAIDESAAVQTRCSKFIRYKEVRASGLYDENFNRSSQVDASFGVKTVGNIEGGAGNAASLRVTYQLDKKLVAEFTDPDAYAQCCQAAPDQCAGKYIGEFFSGTGAIYQVAGAEAQVKAEAAYQLASGDFDFKEGVAWRRVTRFEKTYFAFRTQAASLGQASGDDATCAWAEQVPRSLDGEYLVGVSAPAASESAARELALRDARVQAIRYLGESITAKTATVSSAVEGFLEDKSAVETSAAGLARRIRAEKYCKAELQETPKGQMYVVKVLAFFPKTEEVAARAELAEAMAAQKGVSAAQKKALKAAGETK